MYLEFIPKYTKKSKQGSVKVIESLTPTTKTLFRPIKTSLFERFFKPRFEFIKNTGYYSIADISLTAGFFLLFSLVLST